MLILVTFVLPGFVALRYAELTFRVRESGEDGLSRLMSMVQYSVAAYALTGAAVGLGGLLGVSQIDDHAFLKLTAGQAAPVIYVAGFNATTLVGVLLAEGVRRWETSQRRVGLLDRLGVSSRHRIPTAWEFQFRQRGAIGFVIVTCINGAEIGGYFGSRSFSAYSGNGGDLFLEQRWSLDANGWFVAPIEGSTGLNVNGHEIRSVEFYDPESYT